jgi:hypothetical protein
MILGNDNAFVYWQKELSNRSEGTAQRYTQYFKEFLEFVGKSPNELIVQRQQYKQKNQIFLR